MAVETDQARILRFGPFEVDLRSREIRKGGITVHLQEQPFRLLEVLSERPGTLVTREELRQRLWPADTFVDFDRGLNNAVRRLREALGDSAESPRFIQTLSRRGYRFIAPLSPVAAPAAVAAPASTGDTPPEKPGPEPPPAPGRRAARVAAIVGAVAAAVGGTLYLATLRPPSGSRGRVTLVVLPFANLTGDAEQEYFSDGLTEELIAQLARLQPERLGVIARTSAMHYKGARKRADEIGRELGVDYLLEGTCRRSGNRVRVTVQLVDTRDQAPLWSETYEHEVRDVLQLQASLARDVAAQIRLRLSRAEEARLGPPAPVHAEAYSLYLQGRYFARQRTAAALSRAVERFQDALALQPSYAPAHAGLADVHVLRAFYGLEKPREALSAARQAALAALRHDPAAAEAHTAIALVRLYADWDWSGAEEAFTRALALNPGDAMARHRYGYYYLRARGRIPEAVDEVRRALALDPLSLGINVALADLYVDAGRVDQALDQCRRTLELNSGFHVAHIVRAEAYERRGDLASAIASFERAATLAPSSATPVVEIARLHAQAGRTTEARRILAERATPDQHVGTLQRARLHVALGETGEALRVLEEAYQDRLLGIERVRHDPHLRPLHAHPRFQQLLRRIGPPE
jgi:TolB-like protein/DNA-binding winged helix-turn-helix (wHTH) protein/Flp pilus assembly protein TadD